MSAVILYPGVPVTTLLDGIFLDFKAPLMESVLWYDSNVPVVLKIQNSAGLNLLSTCLDIFKVIFRNM